MIVKKKNKKKCNSLIFYGFICDTFKTKCVMCFDEFAMIDRFTLSKQRFINNLGSALMMRRKKRGTSREMI